VAVKQRRSKKDSDEKKVPCRNIHKVNGWTAVKLGVIPLLEFSFSVLWKTLFNTCVFRVLRFYMQIDPVTPDSNLERRILDNEVAFLVQ